MSASRVYLDSAATSFPKAPGVAEAIAEALGTPGSSGRGVHSGALDAAREVHAARATLASLLGVPDPRDLSFQPGCTHALNLALFGLIGPGDRVVVSSMEHNAVVRPLHAMAQRGAHIVVVDADEHGRLDTDAVAAVLAEEPTRALVVQHASNVSGTIQPIAELAEAAHAAGALCIVDGAQAGGHLEVDVVASGADAWACAGHKGLLGPQGVGVLYLAECCDADPLVYGGTGSSSESPRMPNERPDRYEAGTPNLPGIAGLAAAASYLRSHAAEIRAEEQRLVASAHVAVIERGLRVLGPEPGEPRVPIIAATHPSVPAAQIAHRLDAEFGIASRAGLHCAPWAHRTLGTLSTGAVRFSFGFGASHDDVAWLAEALDRIVGGAA